MRAGYRREHVHQYDEDGSGGQRVGKEGKGAIVGQPVGHDARADDRGDQEAGAERLGDEATREVSHAEQSAG